MGPRAKDFKVGEQKEYDEYRRYGFLRNNGEAIEAAGKAGMSHMAYAIMFGGLGGTQFVKAATQVMRRTLESDDGIDFFTDVLGSLDKLITYQMNQHFPGVDFSDGLDGPDQRKLGDYLP